MVPIRPANRYNLAPMWMVCHYHPSCRAACTFKAHSTLATSWRRWKGTVAAVVGNAAAGSHWGNLLVTLDCDTVCACRIHTHTRTHTYTCMHVSAHVLVPIGYLNALNARNARDCRLWWLALSSCGNTPRRPPETKWCDCRGYCVDLKSPLPPP